MEYYMVILRAGPFSDAASGERFAYLPIDQNLTEFPVLRADEDIEALDVVRAEHPNVFVYCDPEMSVDDGKNHQMVPEITFEMAVLRCSLALALCPNLNLPPCTPGLPRSMLLFGQVPFLESYAAQRLSIDRVIRSKVSGILCYTCIAGDLKISGDEDMVGQLQIKVSGDFGVAQLTFLHLPPESPMYAPLVHAYSTEYIPVFTQADEGSDIANIVNFYGALAVTLHAVGEMPANKDHFTAGLLPDESTKLKADIEIK